MTDQKAFGILLALAVTFIGGIGLFSWWGAQPSPRPKDMPADSIWINGPTLPVPSWHRGWWFGCQMGADGRSNRCKLWDGHNGRLEYEGAFVSCRGRTPVMPAELKLRAQEDPIKLWVSTESGVHLVPVALLANGAYLVPQDAEHGCEELHRELQRKK